MWPPTTVRPSEVSTAAPTANFEYGAYALVAAALAAFKSASGGLGCGFAELARAGCFKSASCGLGFGFTGAGCPDCFNSASGGPGFGFAALERLDSFVNFMALCPPRRTR